MTHPVQSTRFGELAVDEGKVLEIIGGLLGFSERRFVLLTPEKGPFHWLQSVENPDLAFVLTDPRTVVPDYQVKLNHDEHERLGLDESSEVAILSVVTMHPDPRDITINLLGPLVVNPANMKALQVVMEGSGHSTRHPYFNHGTPGATAGTGFESANQAAKKVSAG